MVNDLTTVEVAVPPVEKFEEYLLTKKMRLTSERLIVANAIFSDHEHFDIETIVARLSRRTDGKRVSRATVYRTLDLLEEAGLIRKVARANDREVFEHDYGYPQHDHLICKQCGSLTEFTNDDIASALEKVAIDNGFRMDGHRLEVYGLCAKCARPPKRRHPMLDRI